MTISQLAQMCSMSYASALTDIERLISVGILMESDMVEHPRMYFAPHILDIVYED